MASSGERSKHGLPDQDDESVPKPLRALIRGGMNPRDILEHLNPAIILADDAPDQALWRIIATMFDPPKREKLTQYNTLADAIDLIKKSSKIMVVSGAGISTSAGLPDFRSRDGIYKQIHAEHPDLDDPKQMFDIEFFRNNPLPFYQFAKALYPGQFKPTIGHQFIKCIEDHNKLLRNYTQNIDTLEMQAGIRKVVECHGSFAKATCTCCGHRVTGDDIRDKVLAQEVPKCPECCDSDGSGRGILKPNIVFFGEQLGNEFHDHIEIDMKNVDLLIVIGSSMKVRPVALIPRHIQASVPQILINREPLEHMNFDIELLGNCDHIIQEICLRLGGDWTKLCGPDSRPLRELVGPSELKIKLDDEDDAESSCSEKNENKEPEKVKDATVRKAPARQAAGNESSGPASNDQDDNDDNWEDVEVIEIDSDSDSTISSRTSCGSNFGAAGCGVHVPPSSYIFLKPSRYFFQGAELTQRDYYSTIQTHRKHE